MPRVLVIGAGAGGLSAALALAAAGHRVEVFEAAAEIGGKAASAEVAGLSFDTGPSLLTLVEAFDRLFAQVGKRLRDVVTLRRLDPSFRYVFPDGLTLDFHHELEATHASVRASLGARAAAEFSAYLRHGERIWEASRDPFVFGDAPTLENLARLPPSMWTQLRHIDALRSMQAAIEAEVRDPHLRAIFLRHATYNGSDPRRAPATNGCITHVELGLGAFGVDGGIGALMRAIADEARALGVEFRLGTPARRIVLRAGRVVGLETDAGFVAGDAVVSNAETRLLFEQLLPAGAGTRLDRSRSRSERSTSAWNAVFRARPVLSGTGARAAHTVLFPTDYLEEFHDLFDRRRVPREPAVYLCDQGLAHGRGDAVQVPVFAMVNAPPTDVAAPPAWDALEAQVLRRVQAYGLLAPNDAVIWRRRPSELAARFPGSGGSLYGASSSSRFAAFARVPNRVAGVRGVYVASGTGHPGGGVPLCVLSGLAAARAFARDAR